MLNHDAIRLRHMFDAAVEAVRFTESEMRGSLDTDKKLVLALVKCIEIIGEAAAKVSIECREEMKDIPWPAIISMRNRLIHAYFDINLDILWNTVELDLPQLVDKLDKILYAADTN